MTLVKLDSGDYINTEAVDSIKSGDDPYLVMRCGDVIVITPADCDRIVEAMNPQKTSREILVKEMLVKGQAIADLSAILNYTDGGIDVVKALRGISYELSMMANA